MKNLWILVLLVLITSTMQAQKNKALEAEGNLESPNPCDCIEITKVSNTQNPADILKGMEKCIEQKEFNKAAGLFAIAGIYGRYDAKRVEDQTAHQALLVLQQKVVLNISDEDKKQMRLALENRLKQDSEELHIVCREIQKVGKPNYHPKYMIQHGMKAFTGLEGDGLVKDFKEDQEWELVLNTYLHCDK